MFEQIVRDGEAKRQYVAEEGGYCDDDHVCGSSCGEDYDCPQMEIQGMAYDLEMAIKDTRKGEGVLSLNKLAKAIYLAVGDDSAILAEKLKLLSF